MKLTATIQLELPDDTAHALLKAAGIELAEADHAAAILLLALKPLPDTLRELLLSPDHAPIAMGKRTRMTTHASTITVDLTLTGDRTPCPPPKPAASSSRSRSKSKKAPTKRASARSG